MDDESAPMVPKRPLPARPSTPALAAPEEEPQTPILIEGLPSGVTARRGEGHDTQDGDVEMLHERIRELERQLQNQRAADEMQRPAARQPDQSFFLSATSKSSARPPTTQMSHRTEEVISEQVPREPFHTTSD